MTSVRRRVAIGVALGSSYVLICACSAGQSGAGKPDTVSRVSPMTAAAGSSAGQAALPAADGGGEAAAIDYAASSGGMAGAVNAPGSSGAGGVSGTGSAAGRSAGDLAGTSVAGTAGMTSPTTVDTGTLLSIDDPQKLGPYTVEDLPDVGPKNKYRMFYPMEIGQGGNKHPIISFGPGAGSNPDIYITLLQHLASQGFVVLSYGAAPDGQELIDGIDWLIAQNNAPRGMLSGNLDVDHIAIVGHAAGSQAAFKVAADLRITTTVHLSGGTSAPHADVANLHAPAAFLCGESPMRGQDGTWTGDMANPNCEIDFENTKVPVFYGSLKGAAQLQLTDVPIGGVAADDPLKLKMIGAVVAWLRWQLASDKTQKPLFVGADCKLCAPDGGWTVKQKDLM